jgi:heme-degrading monooxygenase HmoA
MIVILFRSKLTSEAGQDYAETNLGLEQYVKTMPGYVMAKSYTSEDGERLTLVWWRDKESLELWRNNARHMAAKSQGRQKWYEYYKVEIAEVFHYSQFDKPKLGSAHENLTQENHFHQQLTKPSSERPVPVTRFERPVLQPARMERSAGATAIALSPRPDEEEQSLPESVQWANEENLVPVELYPGVTRKILWEQPSGAKALIIEIAPGGKFLDLDVHEPGPEQVYVLSGVFNDGLRDYPVGSFIHNPAGSSHVPQSKFGCKLLVFFPQG